MADNRAMGIAALAAVGGFLVIMSRPRPAPDWVTIQEALLRGEVVKLPRGALVTPEPLLFVDGSGLVGEGMGQTIIQAAGGLSQSIIKSRDQASDCVLASLTIDGAQQVGGYGVEKRGARWTIEHLEVRNTYQDCIWSEWGVGTELPTGVEDIWTDVHLHDAGGKPFTFRGPHDSHFINVFGFRNRGGGPLFERQQGVFSGSNCKMAMCHFWGNGAANVGLDLNGVILDMERCQVEGSDILIRIRPTSPTTALYASGLELFLGRVGVQIVGGESQIDCYCHDLGAAVEFGTVDTPAWRNWVAGKFTNNGTAFRFVNSVGGNIVQAAVRAGPGQTVMEGTPHPNDRIDLLGW